MATLHLMIDTLLNIFKSFSPLTEKDLNNIGDLVSTRELDVGEYWFYEGMRADKIAFIIKGYLRKYLLIDGAEKTDFFYFDHDLTGDLPSIISREGCKSYNVAMEPTQLLTLSYNALDALSEESRTIDRLMRVFAELAFVRYYNKAVSFMLQSPGERYIELVKSQPQVLQRATQYHIASYLGITPQHLSRLRGSL
jgi:CRP-like cAMP-binding protein